MTAENDIVGTIVVIVRDLASADIGMIARQAERGNPAIGLQIGDTDQNALGENDLTTDLALQSLGGIEVIETDMKAVAEEKSNHIAMFLFMRLVNYAANTRLSRMCHVPGQIFHGSRSSFIFSCRDIVSNHLVCNTAFRHLRREAQISPSALLCQLQSLRSSGRLTNR